MDIDNLNYKILEENFCMWDVSHQWLKNFINDRSDEIKTGVEVGVAYGGNINCILDGTSIDKIFGIDPYHKSKYNLNENIDKVFGSFDNWYLTVKNYLSYKYGERVQIVRSVSENAYKKFRNVSLDFVFIDGDHSDIENDVKNWEKKVRTGGYVMGHDWNHPNYQCIQQFLKSYYSEDELKVNEDVDIWYVVKK